MDRTEILARNLAKDETQSADEGSEDWAGFRHNYGGSQRGYYCTPFFEIDVGLEYDFIMALEMFDAERGKVNRQPFGLGMLCNGRVADWMERGKAGRFVSKAKEIEVWQ